MKTHYGVREINTNRYALKFHTQVPLCRPMTRDATTFLCGDKPDCRICIERLTREGGLSNLCITIKYSYYDEEDCNG